MEWFTETLYDTWRQTMAMREVIFRERTEHQDLIIFETEKFGRVLALDGIVQTTEGDEFIYHEVIAHLPIMAHGRATEVLIIGGGDGGTLEEVLKHEGVRRVTQVELDPSVSDLCRRYLPGICKSAFEDPRARLLFQDGARFVAETAERFDVIIVDSTDPIGPGAVLFTAEFYGDCRRCLHPGGILVTQGGTPFTDRGRQLAASNRALGAHFADVSCFSAAIPSYVGGVMAFGWACDDPGKRRQPYDVLAARPLPPGLRFYSPEMHPAVLVRPPWLEALRVGG
jgi:spermidine synthase